MASLHLSLLAVVVPIWALLISPADSLTCTSQKIKNHHHHYYPHCVDLPTLGSYLHYHYHAHNSSLSVAFVSTPPSPDGWVSWAINPTGTGMVGSQAFIAFKSNGTLVVKTYNVSSYSAITESKLSFETWDLNAESGPNGTTVIQAHVKVPEKAHTLNQVWQVGAKVDGGHPTKHELKPENLQAKGPLTLVENGGSPASAPSGHDHSNADQLIASNVGLFLVLVLSFGFAYAL